MAEGKRAAGELLLYLIMLYLLFQGNLCFSFQPPTVNQKNNKNKS